MVAITSPGAEATMGHQVTTEQVWNAIEKNNFAVLGMVTKRGEARTVGIVYVVSDHKLYIGALNSQWKTKHVAGNPHVSMTVAIPRRVPLMPWIKVPATTITFSGSARILQKSDIEPQLLERVYRDEAGNEDWCTIEVTPEKDFVTYGVGMSVLQMRFPEKARARAPVAAAT